MLQDHAPTTTTVGPYELIRLIDKGGMALVYLARQTKLDRLDALKVLNPIPDQDPELAARFVNEARVASSLNHPNVVTTYDFFVHEGRAYIAMEYLRRGSLRAHVRHLSLPQIAGVLECVLAALQHAQSHGIVHRDIKPENVLVADKGVAKLADFGIAKALNSVATLSYRTRTGSTFGTPAYMAPEQALAGEVSVRSDLYSVGVMAYEMVTRQLPFGDESHHTPLNILLGHINGDCPRPGELVPSLDGRLAAWIERMMAREPEDRPAGPDAAWQELEDIIVELEQPMWRRRAALDVETEQSPVASTHLSGFVTFDPGEELFNRVAPAITPMDPMQSPQPVPTAQPVEPVQPPAPAPSLDSLPPRQPAEPAVSVSSNGAADGAATSNVPLAVTVLPKPPVAAAPRARVKRPRVRGRKLALAGGAAALVLGLGGGAFAALRSPLEPALAVAPVEAKIRNQVASQTPVRAVHCPTDVSQRPGTRFACDVALAHTNQHLYAIVTHGTRADDIQFRLR